MLFYSLQSNSRTDERNDDASYSSWWPRHETWNRSGYDKGQWTVHEEEWFRSRRTMLRDGEADAKAGVKPTKSWISAVKGRKAFPRMRAAADRLTTDALIRAATTHGH